MVRAENSLGHSHKSLAAVARAAELSPDNAYMLTTVGYGYINLNRMADAISPLQRAARFAPHDFLAQSQLGYCLYATGQTDAAVTYLKKGAALNSNHGPVWEHLGLAYRKQGRHRDAAKAFERATRINAGKPALLATPGRGGAHSGHDAGGESC